MSEYYFPEVVSNLKKTRWNWARMYRILVREGANVQTSNILYKSVVQVFHLGHCGWGRFPSYRTNIVYHTWRCKKWT